MGENTKVTGKTASNTVKESSTITLTINGEKESGMMESVLDGLVILSSSLESNYPKFIIYF
jgi:hypothetical protein